MSLADLLSAKSVEESKATKESPKKAKPVKQAETKPKSESEPKTETEPKTWKEVNEERQKGAKAFTAPFRIYLAAQKMDVSHIFEENQTYTESQITKAMLQHGYYEFSGSVKYDFVESENILVPIFQQPKKG
ncbi:MAG: hypothetical protein Q4C03_06850 [bacterium]|nr:hypothetical protein [bacterium]